MDLVGSLGGRLFFRLLRQRREVALDNIAQAVANGALDQGIDPAALAEASFANLGRTAMECLRLYHRGLPAFEGRYSVVGGEGLKEALAEARRAGRGVVFLTAHTGCWELSAQVLTTTFDFKAGIVGRSQGFVADGILRRVRSRGGSFVILKHEGARVMLRHLKAGGVLGTLYDQADVVGPSGMRLDFMGRPAQTTLGPLKLAARAGAIIIPYFSRRDGDLHVFEIAEVLVPSPGADRAWLAQTAQRLNDLLGDFIRRHPDQWMWSHRRWKTSESRPEPTGENRAEEAPPDGGAGGPGASEGASD
jgi:KDO2-lipid IV(A) lauroyltransferase